MDETADEMPRNLVGAADETPQTAAQAEGIDEEQWRAENLPSETLELRWRYANAQIPLYERRLRSLAGYHVGPAVQAWVRSRLEWVRDNRLYERPQGVIVVRIDPEGDMVCELEELGEAPSFTRADLVFEGEGDDARLAGVGLAGTLWVAAADGITALPRAGELVDAADTLVRDLAETLGHGCVERTFARSDLDAVELFVASDEFGVVGCADAGGPAVEKMAACFEKLWTL